MASLKSRLKLKNPPLTAAEKQAQKQAQMGGAGYVTLAIADFLANPIKIILNTDALGYVHYVDEHTINAHREAFDYTDATQLRYFVRGGKRYYDRLVRPFTWKSF